MLLPKIEEKFYCKFSLELRPWLQNEISVIEKDINHHISEVLNKISAILKTL